MPLSIVCRQSSLYMLFMVRLQHDVYLRGWLGVSIYHYNRGTFAAYVLIYLDCAYAGGLEVVWANGQGSSAFHVWASCPGALLYCIAPIEWHV